MPAAKKETPDDVAPERITSLHHSPSIDHGLGMSNDLDEVLAPFKAQASDENGEVVEGVENEVEEMDEEIYEEEDYDVEDVAEEPAKEPAKEPVEEPVEEFAEEPVAVQDDEEGYNEHEDYENQEGCALQELVAYSPIPSQAHSSDRNGLDDSIGTEGEKAIALQQLGVAGRDVDRAEMESMMEAMVDGDDEGFAAMAAVTASLDGRPQSAATSGMQTRSQTAALGTKKARGSKGGRKPSGYVPSHSGKSSVWQPIYDDEEGEDEDEGDDNYEDDELGVGEEGGEALQGGLDVRGDDGEEGKWGEADAQMPSVVSSSAPRSRRKRGAARREAEATPNSASLPKHHYRQLEYELLRQKQDMAATRVRKFGRDRVRRRVVHKKRVKLNVKVTRRNECSKI